MYMMTQKMSIIAMLVHHVKNELTKSFIVKKWLHTNNLSKPFFYLIFHHRWKTTLRSTVEGATRSFADKNRSYSVYIIFNILHFLDWTWNIWWTWQCSLIRLTLINKLFWNIFSTDFKKQYWWTPWRGIFFHDIS